MRVARNRRPPKGHGWRIAFEDSDQPFAGVLIPNERRHFLSEAFLSKPAEDKELAHVMGANAAYPLDCRSDQGKPAIESSTFARYAS